MMCFEDLGKDIIFRIHFYFILISRDLPSDLQHFIDFFI